MTRDHVHISPQIDVSLVRRLVADQFPDWSELPINPVEIGGHDNRTFRLGNEMSVRLSSAKAYAAHVKTEQLWLAKLAPHLPLPIPIPLGMGQPAHGYDWPWSVNRWLLGDNASSEQIADLGQFAADLANFLNALHQINTKNAPTPGPDNFFRGGDLRVYDDETRNCIRELRNVVDVAATTRVWNAALESRWPGPPVWIHGDMAVDNLLVTRGRLCAVIDFGQLAAGDPACDVTIAWTLFSGSNRKTFRSELCVDAATWHRGRGWGIWKALLELRTERRTERRTNPTAAERAQRIINDILAD